MVDLETCKVTLTYVAKNIINQQQYWHKQMHSSELYIFQPLSFGTREILIKRFLGKVFYKNGLWVRLT